MNENGELGDSSIGTIRYTPVAINTLGDSYALSIALGYHHNCATLDNNTLECWGLNNFGQIGDSTTTTRVIPTLLALGSERYASLIAIAYLCNT